MRLVKQEPISVVLADDDLFVRETLGSLITAHEGFHLVGTAADGEQALELITSSTPRVALVDIQMPVLDGLQVLARAVDLSPETRVLMLTSFDDNVTIRTALAHGAHGYLLKSARPRAILDAIRASATGSSVVSPEILETLAPEGSPPPEAVDLTEAELDALRLLVLGKSNAEIAADLYLSESSVKARLASAAAKLNTHSRVSTAVRCIQMGLV